jgi:hypothetical protein
MGNPRRASSAQQPRRPGTETPPGTGTGTGTGMRPKAGRGGGYKSHLDQTQCGTLARAGWVCVRVQFAETTRTARRGRRMPNRNAKP